MDYKNELSIDHTALDVEWLQQPQVFMKYAELCADARLAFDKAKQNLEITHASLSLEIRQDPDAFGIEKATEGTINAAIQKSKTFITAQKELNEVRHEFEILSAAQKAFDQRKTALENLVRLHGQQYFAGPTEPRDLDSEFITKAKRKEARDRVRKKRRKS